MPETAVPRGSTHQDVTVRIIDGNGQPTDTVAAGNAGLSFWYRREGGSRQDFAPVALSSLTDPWTAGGFLLVADGYYRLDVPDGAFALGATSVQLGGHSTNNVVIAPLVSLTPQAAEVGGAEPFEASTFFDCNVFLQESDVATHDGCPVISKRRHVEVQKGVCGTVLWTMRNSAGNPLNFSDCVTHDSLSESNSSSFTYGNADEKIIARFQGCDRGPVIAQSTGSIVDATTGKVQFPLPKGVCQKSGIYQFQVAIVRNNQPRYVDSGLISVEPGLWGDTDNMGGPPTIQEIRMHLRDRAAENDLLQAVEFDDAEILEAIRHPVMYWNEMTPDVVRYNCNTFPFRHNWRNAIVAELMRTAIHYYSRNKMAAASSGLSIDDKNKDREYTQLLMLYDQEFKDWVARKKAEINIGMCFGGIGSEYDGINTF